jgi:uncharacterized protein
MDATASSNPKEHAMQNNVNYIELHTPDLDKARAFYGEMFGWSFKTAPGPMRYDELDTHGGIKGGAMPEQTPFWLQYIDVPDLDGAAAKAQRLGAKLLKGRTEVPGHGVFAVLTDPTGATFALWQNV